MEIVQPMCDACRTPATFEVRGHWGDVWARACNRHKGEAALRCLRRFGDDITIRDLDPVIIRRKNRSSQ